MKNNKITRPGAKGLDELLSCLPAELAAEVLSNGTSKKCSKITCDSREARPGSLFIALKGTVVDGHDFISQAVAQGCRCLVVEDDPGSLSEVTVVRVKNASEALGWLAAAFYDFPANSLTLIGLTGTNGKTTVSWMLEQMLTSASTQVGVIGTVNYRYQDTSGKTIIEPAPLTTPGQEQLQHLLRQMVDNGVTHVVMETSSHALQQGRLTGLLFDVAVFTNLSRDHLDFHGGMEEYFAAKKLLFTRYLKPEGQAVIVTEPSGRERKDWGDRLQKELLVQHAGTVIDCGFAAKAAINADTLNQDIHGFSCELALAGERIPFSSQLTGRYNVLNLLAAAGVGKALRLKTQEIISGLKEVGQVPGRLERIQLPGLSEDAQPCVLVDYAHTPDALKNVLKTLRSLATGQLICVFGCGGDRDKGKRPLMGEVSAQFADISLVTTDNPRSEDPAVILQEVAEGLRSVGAVECTLEELISDQADRNGGFPSFLCVEERKKAVHAACVLGGPGDIVLLAGKGHEDYQILGEKRLFYDDRVEGRNGLLCWTLPHLLRALGGAEMRRKGSLQSLLGQVSTDTRTLSSGDIFVALAGENFDGHDYLSRAAEAGAAVVIVEQAVEQVMEQAGKKGSLPKHVVVLQVPDTLIALGQLAAYRRRILGRDLPLIAMTGSCGKTTVKEMTAAIFTRHYQDEATETESSAVELVLKTEGNFNNLIGLPLSLLPVTAQHKVAVMEMGMNQFGEIERLTEIADPDIACITNVQAAHLEGLGSITGVAKAKGELFAGMRPDTVTVVNYDDPHVRRLPITSEKIIGFACTSDGRRYKPVVRATRILDGGARGMRFTLHIGEWQDRINIQAPGIHNVSNCLAAAAMAYAGGVAPETILEALSEFQSTDKRMQMMTLPGGVRVLNDCYNANPASMATALRTVSSFGQNCRRIALLGDMLELGTEAENAHAEIGRQAAELGYDHLAVTGSFASQMAQGAYRAGMAEEQVHIFADTQSMAAWLYQEMIQAGVKADDWLLLKGSRGMRMEDVLQEIEHRFATGINEKEFM